MGTLAPMSATTMRTHRCGELRAAHAGQEVRLGGWVHRRRDLGGLVFIDLRDRDGLVQVAVAPEQQAAFAAASALSSEAVVLVRGTVAARPAGQANPDMATGEIEVRASEVTLVGPAETPPISVARNKGEELAAEERRLRYRHIDLRRPELMANLVLRHRLLQRARRELSERGYLEVETPILTKPTPEGARDYLVPSRVHPGEFYALPQSPQLYKQLLMVSGYDRYFQIARCFRDEDLRADRQPEFTQIDIESSFVGTEDIYALVEGLLAGLWEEAGHTIATPFPRLAFADAMARYGTDKPDLRYGLEIRDVTAQIGEGSGDFLRAAKERGDTVRVIVVQGGASLSRKDFDQLTEEAKTMRATGLLWAKRGADGITGPGAKALGPAVFESLGVKDGDAVVGCAGPEAVVLPALGRVRLDLVKRLPQHHPPRMQHAFVWIEQFPMFEQDPDSGEWTPMHHAFTAPHPMDKPKFLAARPGADMGGIRSTHYDPVYNGNELGSGSIRIVDPREQELVFSLLGLTPQDVEQRFGFLLEGLRAGAPPMGGIALGFDRVVMMLAGTDNMRDVIAFPKTTAARALFEGAPNPVQARDLAVLNIKVTKGSHDQS